MTRQCKESTYLWKTTFSEIHRHFVMTVNSFTEWIFKIEIFHSSLTHQCCQECLWFWPSLCLWCYISCLTNKNKTSSEMKYGKSLIKEEHTVRSTYTVQADLQIRMGIIKKIIKISTDPLLKHTNCRYKNRPKI